MKNTIRYLTLLYGTIIFINACGRKCEEPFDIRDSGVSITFIDKNTKEYLYLENQSASRYKTDSLKVYDQYGKELPFFTTLQLSSSNPLTRYYVISIHYIYNPETDLKVFTQEINKQIYIHYNYHTVDTIKVQYKAYKTKCGSSFKYLNIYYDNNLIANSKNKILAIVTIER